MTIETELLQTARPTVPHLEKILGQKLPVLDHGFVRVIDYMGDDAAIVQAARVSYGKGTKQVNQDKALINYLMRNKHSSPFEMCEIKLHVKLPIFIARQWIRHRTASVNEYSARYSVLGKEFYLPQIQHLSPQSALNKQCRSQIQLSSEEANSVLAMLKSDAEQCYDHYLAMMNQDEAGNIIDEGKVGIARELARMNLTLNHYTEWYWKIDLHNLLHFVKLRAHSHAQFEIREYANCISDIVKKWVPYTYEAFEEYALGSYTFSKKALATVARMIKGEKVTQEASGMTKREWDELTNSLNLDD